MSHQDDVQPNLTPEQTQAAAQAAHEAASAAVQAAAEAATAAAAAATAAATAQPEVQDPANNPGLDRPDAVNTEQDAPGAVDPMPDPDGLTNGQQSNGAETKKEVTQDDAMTDGNVITQPTPSVSVAPMAIAQPTAIQPQPPSSNHSSISVPSVVSPISKKSPTVSPFICDVVGCGKTFGKKFNLKAHKRVHTGDEPFACSYPTCGKRFKWKSSLTFHEGLHLNAPEEAHAAQPVAVNEVQVAVAPVAAATAVESVTAAKKPGKV